MAEHNGTEVIGNENESAIAVGRNGNKVVLRFPKLVEWVVLDAENARQVAEAIARCAYAAHYGVEPQAGRSTIADEKVVALVRRVSIMLNSFMNKGMKPGATAREAQALVDTILAEVL